MGIHNISDSRKPSAPSYPPIAQGKFNHLSEQLARHKDWTGPYDCVVTLFAKHTTEVRLSHKGVQALRKQRFVISYAGKLTAKDNLADKYKKGLGFSM